MKRDDGSSLYYDFYSRFEQIYQVAVKKLWSSETLFASLDKKYRKTKVKVYVEQQLNQGIRLLACLISVADWHRRKDGHMQMASHVIVKADNPKEIHNTYITESGFLVKEYVSLWEGDSFSSCVAQFVFLWLAFIKKSIVMVTKKAAPKYNGGRPVMAVEHAMGYDFDRRSDLFWYPDSGIDPSRIIVYFNREDKPLTPKIEQDLNEMGIRVVSLFQRRPTVRYFIKALGNFWTLACLFKTATFAGGQYWQWCCVAQMLNSVTWWEDFFSESDVKIHISYSGWADPDLVARSIAIDLLEGIDVRFQMSNYSMLDPMDCKSNHVYFSWGPHYYNAGVLQNRSELDFLVYSGYTFDRLFQVSASKAKEIRHSLVNKGAQFILSLFDSSFANTSVLSKAMVVNLYKAFFLKLVECEDLGLIVKPKKAGVFDSMPELDAILSQAKKTKRLLVLDEAVGINQKYQPCDAALASDLAVGFNINSASIEAALSGIPAVHLDLTFFRSHSFYQNGYNQIVFDDVDMLFDTIQAYRAGTAVLGDHSEVLPEIDPFQDGRAGLRVGEYLKGFLEAVKESENRDEALRVVNAQYTKKYGAEMVVPWRQQDQGVECGR